MRIHERSFWSMREMTTRALVVLWTTLIKRSSLTSLEESVWYVIFSLMLCEWMVSFQSCIPTGLLCMLSHLSMVLVAYWTKEVALWNMCSVKCQRVAWCPSPCTELQRNWRMMKSGCGQRLFTRVPASLKERLMRSDCIRNNIWFGLYLVHLQNMIIIH